MEKSPRIHFDVPAKSRSQYEWYKSVKWRMKEAKIEVLFCKTGVYQYQEKSECSYPEPGYYSRVSVDFRRFLVAFR